MDYPQALFEAIADSAVLLDRNGKIIDWNQGSTSLFGYPKKEVLGRSINLIYQHNHPFPKIIQEILPQHKKWFEDIGFVRKNGIPGYCKASISLIQHSSKTTALLTHHNLTPHKELQTELQKNSMSLTQELKERLDMFYICNSLLIKNVTQREQAEKTLRESEIRFHLLAENSTDMISRHSPDGSYLYVSPSCQTLLGYGQEDLIGRTAYKFLHPDDINKLKKVLSRRRTYAPYYTITYRIQPKNGDSRWFESIIRIIPNENTGRIREIQMASRDVTDRVMDKKDRLRGQQLAHVFRLSSMEEMASGMAHEISQPLAAVVNYTQGCVRYLRNNNHDQSQLIEIMNKAVAQAERAGEVIHRLKNFFCKGQLIKTPCKVTSLIREAVGLIRSDLNRSKTKVDFEMVRDLPLISLDKIQFQQVVLNLIQNAIEAMQDIKPKERKILIQVGPVEEGSIEVTVNDSGPGFSKDIISNVFKPFFTTKAHGRGMGLAICRSIIEAHGGQFTINPNGTGRSWIKFTLPT